MEGNLDSENSDVTGGLGVGVVDDDMSRLAKEVASLLRKRWPQSARNTLRPDAN